MGLPRTSTDSVLFSTYNVLNLYQADSPAEREHARLVAESIRALDTDVLAVQEIRAPNGKLARARLRQLADDVGMRCMVPGPAGGSGRSAVAVAGTLPIAFLAIDFDKATRDRANPLVYSSEADSGDHLHPKDAGYSSMADSVDLTRPGRLHRIIASVESFSSRGPAG